MLQGVWCYNVVEGSKTDDVGMTPPMKDEDLLYII